MKIGSFRYLPLAILILTMTVGCKKRPSGILSQDDMASLMADVYRGESMVEYNGNIYSDDSTRKIVKQSVLAAHGISQEDFERSLDWYGHHIEEYVKVCDDAIALLENELEKIPDDAVAGSILVAGDSARVWPLPSFYRITPNTPSRYLSFTIEKDDEWKPGDTYELSYKINIGKNPVESTIAVTYEDSVAEFISTSTTFPGWQNIVLRLDSTRMASSLYGFIHFNPQPNEVIYLDSISLTRTRLNPSGYYRRSSIKPILLKPVDESKKK